MIATPRKLLLIEDHVADQELMKSALTRIKSKIDLVTYSNASEALDYLERCIGNANPFELPSLVLLDLEIPGMDGREFLKSIRSHPDFKWLPVIVWSGHSSQEEINHCYELGCNSFLAKQGSLHQLVDMMMTLERQWFELGKLPRRID